VALSRIAHPLEAIDDLHEPRHARFMAGGTQLLDAIDHPVARLSPWMRSIASALAQRSSLANESGCEMGFSRVGDPLLSTS